MLETKLDLNKTALVIIDMQNDLVHDDKGAYGELSQMLSSNRVVENIAKVISVKEFTHWSTATPAGDAFGLRFGRFVETADQGRQNVAIGGVVVVSGAIQVGGHQADRVKAMLLSQCFA